MRQHTRVYGVGLVATGLVAMSLVVAVGAQRNVAPVTPRYSVDYAGAALLITDNQTNLLYIYQNVPEGARLGNVLDLNDTGQELLKGQPAPPRAVPKKDVDDLSGLEVDRAVKLTCNLVGTVRRVTDESLLVEVDTLEHTEAGVPIHSKIPYVQRLFRNTGVNVVRKPSLIEIPRDQVERVQEAPDRETKP